MSTPTDTTITTTGDFTDERPCDNERSNSKVGLIGAFIPQCKSDGNYEEKQCDGSTGYCWCVESESGKYVDGTKKGPGAGEVNCDSKDQGPCDEARTKIEKEISTFGIQDAFVPECEADGTYKEIQCYGFTGHCYCVDPQSGKEIEGTRSQGEVNCCELVILSFHICFLSIFTN